MDATSRTPTAFPRWWLVARDVGAKRMLVHRERHADLDLDTFRIETEYFQDSNAPSGIHSADPNRRVAVRAHGDAVREKEAPRFSAELDVETVPVEERREDVGTRSRLAQIDVREVEAPGIVHASLGASL